MGLKELQDSDRKIIRHLLGTDRETKVSKTHTELDNEIDDITTSWISQRLNHLVEEGFLEVEKEGRKKYYSLAEDHAQVLQLMDIKEKDAEFVQETPVEWINSTTDRKIGFETPSITQYNRADREELSQVQVDLKKMREELGEKATTEDIMVYAAKKQFEESTGLRETLSEIYDEMAEEGFQEDDKEKVLDAKEELLDVLIKDTRYTEKSGVEATLPIRNETVTVKGDSLRQIYSSVPDNEVFPDVDSEAMQHFMRFLDGEVRDALKSAIIVKNY